MVVVVVAVAVAVVMNILSAGIEDRESEPIAITLFETLWFNERMRLDEIYRLRSWDIWLRGKLARTLVWPSDMAKKEKMISQSAAMITAMARHLHARGWLLDGAVLAMHVDELLAPVAEAQRAGHVRDLWPYLRTAVARYVGDHAEEIQRDAKRFGMEVATAVTHGKSTVELINERSVLIVLKRMERKKSDSRQMVFI